MPHYPYLIIGGGMTAAAAMEGIRQVDSKGAIGLIGTAAVRPYNRPPLSKSLWKGDALDTIWRELPKQGLTLHLDRTAVALDPAKKSVVDDTGTAYTYDRLLLATGCSLRRLPFGGETIIYYRTLADYQHLRARTERSEHFAVIGGGASAQRSLRHSA